MYLLPSLFTAGNIGAGYYAITQSIQGTATNHADFDHAALAIGLAALLDGVDGFIARLTNTASDFGRELDSLADVITFGVAPSLLAYLWGFRMLPATAYPALRDNVLHGGLLVCFLFLICGASRLARFNIAVNPQPRNPGKPGKKFFVGMPIPAGAGVIAAVVHCFDGSPIYNAVDVGGVAGADLVYGLSDGEQLALLECEGDYFGQAAAVPVVRVDCADGRADRVEVGVDADGDRAGISGFGSVCEAGVFVGAAATACSWAWCAAEVNVAGKRGCAVCGSARTTADGRRGFMGAQAAWGVWRW